MRVYKPDNSKNYRAEWYENRKRRRKSLGVADKATAELIAARWQSELLEARIFNKKPSAHFNDWIIEYSNHLKSKNRRLFDKSAKYRLRTINNAFGDTILQEITALQIRQFYQGRLDQVSRDSAQSELNLFKAMFNYAREMGAIDEVPKFPKIVKPKERVRYLSKDEEKRLLAETSGYLRALLIFAMDTGGRKSELLNVDWEDIDLENRIVHFRVTKGDENGRRVPLTNRVHEVLSGHNGERRGPVFTYRGKRLKDPKKSFTSAVRKAEIENFRFHDLRHTFASRLVQNRISLLEVQKLMGHKSIRMTERYSHLAPDFAAAAVFVLNQLNSDDDSTY